MTVKEHLQQVYTINQRIKRLQARREDLRADLYCVKSPQIVPDKVQTSLTGDKMLNLIAKVDELERDMVDEIDHLTTVKQSIISEIEKVPEERYRQLLFDRYILCMKWERIALDRDKNVRGIYKLHGKALNSFKNVVKVH